MQRRDDPPALIPLFDEIARRPADDAPRQVLADALMERGDARGEFLMLQLLIARGLADATQTARAGNLLKHHYRKWFDEVPGIVREGAELHRGFLRRARLMPTGKGADSPTWRMVEALTVQASPQRAEELNSPWLTRLEVLEGLDAMSLPLVLAGPARPFLRTVAFNGPSVEDVRPTRQVENVLALTAFPSLERVTLTPSPRRYQAERLGWLFESKLARQLRWVRFSVDLPWDVFGFQEQLVRHRCDRLVVELETAGLRFELGVRELRIRFDDARSFDRHAQSVRNAAARFTPAPYPRVDVRIGDRVATASERSKLGRSLE